MTVGFDNYSINHQLLLGATFEEMTGVSGDYIFDRAKPHHLMSLQTAGAGALTWSSMASGYPYIDFASGGAGNETWIECTAAASNDLNFTTEDFSMVAWINIDDLSATRMILCRGATDGGGWYFWVTTTGEIALITNQAVHQTTNSAAGTVATGTWYLIGATRGGAVAKIYCNGKNVTSVAGTHINPTAIVAELHIGIYNDEAANVLDGSMAYPRIWGDRKLEEADMLEIFNVERHKYGV